MLAEMLFGHPLPMEGGFKGTWLWLKTKLGRKDYTFMTGPELASLMETGAKLTIVDCRHKEIYDNYGHIDGAINHPLSGLKLSAHNIPRNHPVVTICYFGYFGQAAAQHLARLGHKNVRTVHGGMDKWNRLGLPVIGRPQA